MLRSESSAASHVGSSTAPAVPLMRMMSLEQRWQDLASVLLLPGQEATSPAPPAGRPGLPPATVTQQPPSHDTDFIAAAGMASVVPPVAAADGAQTCAVPAGGAAAGDMTYYQLAPAVVTPASAAPPEMAPPQLDQEAAFLSQLLGVDDDLDMPDVPITLAAQGWSSSSERTGGGSSPPTDHISSSAPGFSDSSSSPGSGSGSDSGFGSGSQPRPPRLPVAQKKHHMYGKRAFQNQDGVYDGSSPASVLSVSPSPPSPVAGRPERYGAEGGPQSAYPAPNTPAPSETATIAEVSEVKYSRTEQFTRMSPRQRLSPVSHNHTYQQPAPIESASDGQRPVARDKTAEAPRRGERLSRDEKRTRAMNIPMTAEEIVHLPMEEFNERLARHQLTEAQLSLVRDVRRRGKNKLAAQNCRKRKLDQIQSLTEDLQKVREQRQRTLSDHQLLTEERARIRDKYARLHQHVFQSLRDGDGRPYSPSEYSLQLSADGDVLLVPRSAARGAAIVPGPLPAGRPQ